MEELSPLVTAQLCRGVRTNNAMTTEDYRREIGAGTLYVHLLEAGLLLLRRRPGHWRMSYYLGPGAAPFSLPAEGVVAVELPFRPKDAPMEGELLSLFQASGFRERMRRVRLERPAGPVPAVENGFAFRPARKEDLSAALDLLISSFDPVTGCLPTGEELELDIAAGNLLCAFEEDGRLAGLLHSSRAKASAEVRHLAVRSGLRGRRCGQGLLAHWLVQADCKARVWTGADNEAALRTYGRGGFAPDGWYSVVMACELGIRNDGVR